MTDILEIVWSADVYKVLFSHEWPRRSFLLVLKSFKELEWWINFIEKNTFLGLDKYPDETTLKLACMDRELWAKTLLIIIANSHKISYTASFCHCALYKYVTFHNGWPFWFDVTSCWNLIGCWWPCLLNCRCDTQRICLYLTPRRWKLKCTIFTWLVIWLRIYFNFYAFYAFFLLL